MRCADFLRQRCSKRKPRAQRTQPKVAGIPWMQWNIAKDKINNSLKKREEKMSQWGRMLNQPVVCGSCWFNTHSTASKTIQMWIKSWFILSMKSWPLKKCSSTKEAQFNFYFLYKLVSKPLTIAHFKSSADEVCSGVKVHTWPLNWNCLVKLLFYWLCWHPATVLSNLTNIVCLPNLSKLLSQQWVCDLQAKCPHVRLNRAIFSYTIFQCGRKIIINPLMPEFIQNYI